MKKKLISMLLCSAVLLSVFAGCNSNTSTSTPATDADNAGTQSTAEPEAPEETGEDNGEVVTITYWDQNADTVRTEIFNAIIADFEAENPNIKVDFVAVPASDAKSKYDVAIQSNTAPDCGGVSQYWISDFLAQDALVPLDEYIASWDNAGQMLSVYDESIRNMAADGQAYGLAHTVTLPAVWYNTNMFEDADLGVPQNWDDIFDAIAATTDKGNGVYGFSLRGGAGGTQQLEQMIYQYSGITDMFVGGASTINDPLHVEYLEKLAAIYNVYTPESDITNGYAEMVSAFDSGSAAMIFHNLGSYQQHVDTLGLGNFGGLASLESVDGNSVIISNGCMALSVFRDSEHPAEAFKFISYLAEHKASSQFSEGIGQIPCNTSALEDAWLQEAETTKLAAEALLDSSTVLCTLPIDVIGYYDLHNNDLEEGFQNVLLGNLSAQDYLDDWAGKMSNLYEEYQAYRESL